MTKKKYRIIKMCPLCGGRVFDTVTRLQEINCCNCGLVIQAPPTASFKTDGYKIIRIKKNEKQE